MKIGKKLLIFIIALNVMGTGILLTSLLALFSAEKSRLEEQEISNLAALHGKIMQVWLEIYMDAARTAGQIMEEYQNIEASLRRDFFATISRTLVEKNIEIAGAASIWEPGILDGPADSDTSGEADRFMPYWYRSKNGIVPGRLEDHVVIGTEAYYQDVKRIRGEMIMDPYYYPIDGVDTLITTLAVPMYEADRFIGAVTVNLELEHIQREARNIQPYEGTVTALYSNNGVIIAHFDENRIGQSIHGEGDIAGSHLAQLTGAIKTGRALRFTNYVGSLGETIVFISVPFTIGRADAPWTLMIGIPQRIFLKEIRRMTLIGMGIGITTFLLTASAAFFIARSIASPLKNMIRLCADIGQGDLTKLITVRRNDEIGEMTHSFNGTVENIRSLIRVIKDKAVALSTIGAELQSHTNQTAGAVAEIAGSLKNMKTQAANQSASVEDTVQNIEKITQAIEEQNAHIDRQAASVSQSSAAIEEMLASIQSVTQRLINNTSNMNFLTEASESGRLALQAVSADIEKISRDSEGLVAINAVIENIAGQTNLLAMNAAIEAAHAGEAGKGFAVVSEEIRKLAESSAEQSKTISEVLKQITISIDTIGKSAAIVRGRFEGIEAGVQTVAQQEEHIRNSMEEQGEGSKQILDAVEGLNGITASVKAGSSQMLASAQEVIAESQVLGAVSRDLSQEMRDMAANAERINGAVDRIFEITTLNKDHIGGLLEAVARFTVEA
ncbi:MAG: methyl-accepting chemotaxis protein [Treponema sp.]|jgi:methyl-accepting chemotaxis protein|nr:methyl-accepting chemotaxis protein [Treponema sp.]